MTAHFILIMDHAKYGRFQPEIDLPVTRDKLIEQIIEGEYAGEFSCLIEVDGTSVTDLTKAVEAEIDGIPRHEDGSIKRTDPNAEHRLTSQGVLGGWM